MPVFVAENDDRFILYARIWVLSWICLDKKKIALTTSWS